jgi:hypothetical protein
MKKMAHTCPNGFTIARRNEPDKHKNDKMQSRISTNIYKISSWKTFPKIRDT